MFDPHVCEMDAAPSRFSTAVPLPFAWLVVLCIAPAALIGAWTAPAAQGQSTPPMVQGPADLAGFSDGAASVADVDGDGTLDVLVAGQSKNASRSSALYLGNGDGTFSEASVQLPSVSSASTAIGDVNNDGDADLLITGETSSGFGNQTLVTEVYLGNGDGTFTPANASLTGIDEGAAAIADVNNDDNDDLILTGNTSTDTNSDTPSTLLYLSNGDGTFDETSTSVTDVFESAVATGDVDADGNVDVLVSGNGGTGLFFGNGDGTFTAADATPSNFALLQGAASIADIDGDGNQDFFVVGKRPLEPSTRATIYYGDGNRGFTAERSASTGLRPANRAAAGVADVDGDGNQDIIIAGLEGPTPFATVFRSNGDRTFSPGSSSLPPTSGGSIAIADVYGDGDPDVLITGSEEDGSRVSELFINNTNQPGSNRAPTVVQGLAPDTLAAGQTLVDTVEARDPDGDPVTLRAGGATPNVTTTALDDATVEVRFAPSRVQAGRTPSLSIQADDARGASTTISADARVSPFFARLPSSGLESVTIRGGAAPTADVNGDGRTDVFVAATATLYLGQEDGTLQKAGASLGTGNQRAGAADFGDVDDDGNVDLVTAFDDPNSGLQTTVYLGNGDGTFTEATGADLTGVENGAVRVTDVNSDGNDDVIVTGDTDGSQFSESPSTTIYLSDGDGTFRTPGSSGLTDLNGDDVAVGTVDGDSNLDVVIVGGSDAELFLGNGDGTFREDTPFNLFPSVDNGSAAIGDATGDGAADVLIAGSEFGTPVTTLFAGNGDGTFSESSASFLGIETGTAGVVDANGDGNPDVFVSGNASASSTLPQTRLYLGDGSGGFSVAGAGVEGTIDPPIAFGDFDGDGDADLVLPSLGGTEAGPLYQNLGQERTPSASVTQTIGSGGTFTFSGTGVSLRFSSVSSSGDVTVERFDNAPFDPTGIIQSTVSEYRLVVEPDNSFGFGGSAEVRLSVSAFSGIDDPTEVQIYSRPTDGSSEFTGLQTTVEDQGTPDPSDDVLVASTSSFSEFVLASNTQPLPVELAGFDATVDGASVRLTWQTASEAGNAGFEVQRRRARASGASSAAEWTTVGYREGAGTTSSPRRYRFVDEVPYEADRLVYRLKQVDTDGTASYSTELTVRRGVDELTLLGTYPNPARRRATVRFAVPERQEVTVRLYDVLGRRVRTAVRRTAEGRQETTLDVGDLSSGVYVLRLRAGGETRTRKLTVVR